MNILVVDDHATNRKLLRAQLETEGHTVMEASDGIQALAILDRAAVDGVISDILMPNMDGFNLCREIRRSKKFGALPFILYTSTYDSPGDRQLAEAVGVDRYVVKPAPTPVILDALHEATLKTRERKHPQVPEPNEASVLKQYSEALVRKLEEKNTELQEMLEKLSRAEQKYRSIFERSIEGIFQTTPDGRFLMANPAMARILGHASPEELIAQRTDIACHYIDPAERDRFKRLVEACGSVHGFEYQVYRKDGAAIWVSENAQAVRDTDGSVLYYEGTLLDITERKRAEQQIRELAALLEKTQDAIYVRDLEQRITYWNSGAVRLYGWTAEEVLDKRVLDLLYKGDSPQLQEARRAVMQTGEWAGEVRQYTKSGREVIVQSSRTLLCDASGRPNSLLSINTDITEKKQMESQFLRAQRMESIGVLAGGVAHDLNNVLAPILMGMQLLRLQLTDEAGVKLVDRIESSAQRGADLVKQILSFARGIEGKRTVIQLKHLISDQAKICKETFPPAIAVRRRIPQELWPVLGDATQLHQVLMNLCVNARDAMPAGGTLTLEAENAMLDATFARTHGEAKPGPHAVVTVKDTGTGVPPDVLDKIFDPFFTTKEVGKGTGLGLSTVLGIVKSHGGFLKVFTESGRGSAFKVYLPAALTDEMQQRAVQEPTPCVGNGELVLVVDDELSIREITKGTLEANGYRVMAAGDGAEAIMAYVQRAREISLVITDMSMPFMDGVATIRALRKVNPDVRIIAVSGTSDTVKLSNVTKSEDVVLLHKPFSAGQLLSLMQEMLKSETLQA